MKTNWGNLFRVEQSVRVPFDALRGGDGTILFGRQFANSQQSRSLTTPVDACSRLMHLESWCGMSYLLLNMLSAPGLFGWWIDAKVTLLFCSFWVQSALTSTQGARATLICYST